MQPEDVRVLQGLEHIQLFYDKIVSSAALGVDLSTLQSMFVHFLDGKLLIRLLDFV